MSVVPSSVTLGVTPGRRSQSVPRRCPCWMPGPRAAVRAVPAGAERRADITAAALWPCGSYGPVAPLSARPQRLLGTALRERSSGALCAGRGGSETRLAWKLAVKETHPSISVTLPKFSSEERGVPFGDPLDAFLFLLPYSP